MTAPSRIQRRRIKGWRLPANTVCVGRGSKWGNPFRIGPAFEADGMRIPAITPESAVRCYADYLDRTLANWESSRQAVRALAGANLACWCRVCLRHQTGKPFDEPCRDCAPCHADILGQRANALACEATNG
jgi:hypothetical protein